MNKQFSPEELYHLRSDLSLEILITALKIPYRHCPGDVFRFECPRCFGYQTAIHHKTNLARCFNCRENFNSIELVMLVKKLPFVASVKLLQRFKSKLSLPKTQPSLPNSGQSGGLFSVGQILQQIALAGR